MSTRVPADPEPKSAFHGNEMRKNNVIQYCVINKLLQNMCLWLPPSKKKPLQTRGLIIPPCFSLSLSTDWQRQDEIERKGRSLFPPSGRSQSFEGKPMLPPMKA